MRDSSPAATSHSNKLLHIMPPSSGTPVRASTVKKSSLPVAKVGFTHAPGRGSTSSSGVARNTIDGSTADDTMCVVDVMGCSFPSFTLVPPSTSHGYTVSNMHLNKSFKFILDNTLLQTVTEERKEEHGFEFITIGIPQQFANHLVGELHAEFPRPIENNGYQWFNVTIASDFGRFEVRSKEEVIKVDMLSFALDSGEAISARLLVNAYVSRSGRGGNPFIRIKLHHAQIKNSSSVLPPDPSIFAGKSFTRLPPAAETTEDTLFAAFAALTVEETEEEDTDEGDSRVAKRR